MEIGVDKLAKNPQSKEYALDTLDFILNVLKEHEKDLDKLINELATVTKQLGEIGELSSKLEKVEEKINNLQEVTNLIGYLSGGTPKETLPVFVKGRVDEAAQAASARVVQGGSYVILRCKHWGDFQTLAFQAQTLSFSHKDDEKVFQVDALKDSQIITYNGALPKFSSILRTWLSEQLDVAEKNIWEGDLGIGQVSIP